MRSAYLFRSDEEGPEFSPLPCFQKVSERDEMMLISTRIRQNPLLMIAKDHHKMVLSIDPEPVIHQDDKGKPEIDVLSNIFKAPRILRGL